MKTYKIHLIRHGLTEANIKGQYVGNRTDLPLCNEGIDELRALRDSIDYPDIERLYTSPMSRCRQTAGIIYPDTEYTVIDEFTEYDFGDFEGKTARELEKDENFALWAAGKIAAPGGESTENFIKRLAMGFRAVVEDMMKNGATNAAAIMHGGSIMMLLSNCAVPRRGAVEWQCENGRGYSVSVTPSLYHSSGIIEVYDII